MLVEWERGGVDVEDLALACADAAVDFFFQKSRARARKKKKNMWALGNIALKKVWILRKLHEKSCGCARTHKKEQP